MTLQSINPHGGSLIATYPDHTDAEVSSRLDAAVAAQRMWAASARETRASFLVTLASSLRRHADTLAVLATTEMGKPITASRAEVEKCARCCEWYAAHAALLDPVDGPLPGDSVRLEPLGVLFAIMPWNFPYWQVVRVLAPALLLGNTVVLKHAENVTGCALALRDAVSDAVRDAGAPDGLFDVLQITRDHTAAVIADPRVAAVTLTGSERAGAAVAAAAGAALKPMVLELGGSDPFIVWHDAPIAETARAAAAARCVNSGQSCIAAKRFLVHTRVYDAFVEAFVAAMRALVVSDPRATATDMGPLVSIAAREALHQQVQATIDAGATLLLGATPPAGPTPWYPPTVLTDIPDGTPMANEELFGPVAGVWRVTDFDDAVARANSTRFGLGASVWTADPAIAARFATALCAGSVMINQPIVSDPALPFGGVKASGYGRELGLSGLAAFANVKTVRGLATDG